MYYLLYGIIYLFSLLPMPVMYLISDLLYEVVYHVTGYRKNVVMKNLRIAFPHKTEKERVQIAKRFYRNFCDALVETLKMASASQKFVQKHFTANYSLINDLHKTGKSLQVHLGHNFNWEIGNISVPPSIVYKSVAVYMPMRNKIVNRVMLRIRTRFNNNFVAATNMKEDMLKHFNTQYILWLVADQKPADPTNAYWIKFFGKLTPFLRGPERSARRNNFPVLFAHVKKVKRGYYHGYIELVTMEPKDLQEGELTKMFVGYLEKVMTDQPETWLWSHNRWKWDFNEEQFGKFVVD